MCSARVFPICLCFCFVIRAQIKEQDITEQDINDTLLINQIHRTGSSTLDAPILITTPKEALPVIQMGEVKAITGTVLFLGATTVEIAVLNPWANRVLDEFKNAKTHDDSTRALGDDVGALLASLPVGLLKTIGPTLACAGASRAYGAWHDGINNNIPDIQVWKPYIAGWVIDAIGGVIGFLAGLSDNKDMANVSNVISYAGDACWGWATIWSLVYASNKQADLKRQKITFCPNIKNGCIGISMLALY